MNAEQQLNQWGQIVAKTWQDDAFKKRLIANPSAVLKVEGLVVAPGVQVRVVENTDKLLHLTLPARPRGGELSEAELEGVAGGRLSRTLVQNLAKVFNWDVDQVNRIEAAGRIGGSSFGPADTVTPASWEDGRE